MTRILNFLAFGLLSISSIASSAALPPVKRAESTTSITPTPSPTLSTKSTTPNISHTATIITSSSTPLPTQPTNSDNGDSDPPPAQDPSYYENQGASGSSSAFINVPLGAQIGIIIAIVLVGIASLVGCIMFYLHKRRQWEAAAVRRRTKNARSLVLATKFQKEEEERARRKTRRGSDESDESVLIANGRGNSNVRRGLGVRIVEQGRFEGEAEKTERKWMPRFLGR